MRKAKRKEGRNRRRKKGRPTEEKKNHEGKRKERSARENADEGGIGGRKGKAEEEM